MSQEVSKRLGSVGYNRNIPHLQVGEITTIDPITIDASTSNVRDIQVGL